MYAENRAVFLQDYQDFFGLVWLDPVHPVDPVRKWKVHAVKFFIRSDRPFFWPAAGLNGEPPGPDLNLRCSIIQIHIWEPDSGRNMIL
jgi:hypothetical protein